MPRKLALRTIAALCLFAGVAGNAVADEVWTPWTRITVLYPNSGGLTFNTAYANTNLNSCDSGTRWTIEPNHPNYSLLSATLIAAYMAGKQVMLNITTGPSLPCAGYVNRFMVKD